jgi:hypothetical protein
MHDCDSKSELIAKHPFRERQGTFFAMAWVLAMSLTNAIAADPAAQGSAGTSAAVTPTGQHKVSPHIIAAQKRAASGQASGQANGQVSRASAGLQAQMQKQAARRQVVTKK